MLLALAVLLVAPPQVEQEETPDRERVEKAVAALKDAFERGDAADRVLAIQRGAQVADAAVVEEIAAGLTDDERDVRMSAIGALRHMDHADALEQLAKRAERELRGKKSREHAEELAALLQAVGQHAAPATIDLFEKNAFGYRDGAVIRARILSLGRIRTAESVEALMGLMRKAGRRKVQPHMSTFRLALLAATGVDQGRSQDLWLAWWNDRKKDFKAPEKEPLMPRRDKQAWDRYWGAPRRYERPTKRADRGKDPDRGRG